MPDASRAEPALLLWAAAAQAVSRESGAGAPGDAPLDAADCVFAGTLCTAGHAEAEVLATGMHTELGRVAALSQRVRPEVSPLQRQVNRAALTLPELALLATYPLVVWGGDELHRARRRARDAHDLRGTTDVPSAA